jgi:hypothetical protein
MTIQSGRGREIEHGKVGPNWLIHLLERRYARLEPKEFLEGLATYEPRADGRPKPGQELSTSLFIPGPGKAFLAELPSTHWLDVRRAWSDRLLRDRRFRDKRPQLPGGDERLPAPGIPGLSNWVPIGPSVVRRGQATGNPAISGRAVGLAIAPGGSRVYVATADGGVWRSDDAGASWRSTMDGFDIDPTAFASTSTACGAIALDPADPNRVYVGTGEGETNALFASRLQSALPSYRGIGPIRTDNGGATWQTEPTAPGSPTLVGSAFFALAVDPGDRDNVVAATNIGLYRREPDGAGSYHWVQKGTGIYSSVTVCRTGGVTTFFAAAWRGGPPPRPVFSSPDGDVWTTVGTSLPVTAQRITLGTRPTDPSIVYALVGGATAPVGLYRFDSGGAGRWHVVSGLPTLYNSGDGGSYCLSLAVDPNDANTVFIAGTSLFDVIGLSYNASIYRCSVTSSGAGGTLAYAMTTTFIGSGVHADVHALVHIPGESRTLWAACDGGVFRTTSAITAATFTHRNTGLATLSANFFTQHPTQLAVMLVGLQDNGTARYTGEEAWLHVVDGDGGYCLINWNDPNQVLAYVNGEVRRATDGGQGKGSFTPVLSPPWVIMAEPLVGTPYAPTRPINANTVAFGAGTSLYISDDFGQHWSVIGTLPQNIFALAFYSPGAGLATTLLYVGTVLGQVYRFARTGTTWGSARLDNVVFGALPLAGLITDIEVDPADATGVSIYLTFGGSGDRRHVWHFDGTRWEARSGSAASGLPDVEHNAIVVDPLPPFTLYVGTDIGVWSSLDSGATWSPLQNGLPDAAVFDLQIHPTTRLLRASTHGRGMFEYRMDPPIQPDVELYVRDTSLDVGRFATVDLLSDPETWPAEPVRHYLSRNIKIDVPTPEGYQTPSSVIDFLQFNDTVVDGSQGVGTMDPAAGTVVNRVYVEVHNRGVVKADKVQVMLLLTKPSVALAPLPVGYEANVLSGTDISDANWQTVGIRTLTDLRAGFPQVAGFHLPSTMLPPPADLPAYQQHCLVALLHSLQDPYTSTDTGVDALTVSDAKVAQRSLQVFAFEGTPPASSASDMWMAVDLFGVDREERPKALLMDLRHFQGEVGLLLSQNLAFERLHGFEKSGMKPAERWAERHTEQLRRFIAEGRFHCPSCRLMMVDIRSALSGTLLMANSGYKAMLAVEGLHLAYGKRYPLFLRTLRKAIEPGTVQEIHLYQYDPKRRLIEGGNTWRIVGTREYK